MATTYSLSGTAADATGGTLLTATARQISGYLELSEPTTTATDTGETRFGTFPLTFAGNGTWTVTGVPATNVAGWMPQVQAVRIVVKYVDPGTHRPKGYTSNWFYLTANSQFKDLVQAEQVAVQTAYDAANAAAASAAEALVSKNAAATSATNAATSATNAATQATNAATAAGLVGTVADNLAASQTARSGAEAARDGAVAIVGPVDGTVAGLINNTGGIGPQTTAALNATYARQGKARGAGLVELGRRAALVAAGTITRFPWVYFGDSMSAMKFTELEPVLSRMLDVGGTYKITNNATTGTVTENTADFAKWITGKTTTLATGASRTLGSGGGSPICDTIKVGIILDGGGTFKLQIDGVDAAGYENVATTGSGGLSIITLTPALGAHTVKIVNLTGTVKYVAEACGFIDSTRSGLVPVPLGQGGIELVNMMTAQARTNLQTFLADLNPAVFTFEMRETDDVTFRTHVDNLFADVRAAVPKVDLIGWGAPWDGRTGTTGTGLTYAAWVAKENADLRAAVEAVGGVYWDGNQIIPDWATINANGWGADPIHPAQGLSKFYLPLIMRDLGFQWLSGVSVGQSKATHTHTNIQTELAFAGKDRVAPEAKFLADTGGFDLSARFKRWFRLYDETGATEIMRLVFSGATRGWLPAAMHLGSSTNGAIYSNDGTTVELRRGDTFTKYANLRARAVRLAFTTASTSGAVTADFTDVGIQVLTLTGNATNLTFSGGVGYEEVELHLIQDGTGSRLLSGSASAIKWAGGTRPTLSTTAGARDIFRFRYIGGSWYEVSRSMDAR